MFESLLWGLFAGGALILGALVGYFANPSQKLIAEIMAFGSGVLISVLSFDLIGEAFKEGGLLPCAIGFLGGTIIYTGANELLTHLGARHRKRSRQPKKVSDNGLAIAIGALIDGIPESIAIGLTLLKGGSVGIAIVIGIFISNIPEGLSSTAGLKSSGKSKAYIFGLWIGIAILSGIASLLGFSVFGNVSKEIISAITAAAAGGIIAMIADTMIPEAFSETHTAAGMIISLGFLAAFILSHVF